MNNIHDNWRKFLTEGAYDESKLLREITDEELEHIETAIYEMGPEDMAFNELFGGKQRILIPFAAGDLNTELGQFLSIVGTAGPRDNYEPIDKTFSFAPNWEKGIMERVRTISPEALADYILGDVEPKRVVETMKIGKWLSATERAIKKLIEWRKTFDADMPPGYRPSTEEDQQKELKIGSTLTKLIGMRGVYDITDKFRVHRDSQNYSPSDTIDARLDKVIERIQWMKSYWQKNADYIKKNPQGDIDSNTFSIVITRNPIDILRMSDFDNITSCHSPASRAGDRSYYHCAVAEAHGEGAVAYVVYNGELEEAFAKDIENITLDNYEDTELFYDEVRDVGKITPISRLRIRLVRHYENDAPKRWDEGVDIAVPEERVYGKKIPGFREAIMKWAKTNQSGIIDKIMSQKGTLDLGKFTAFGGSYGDNLRQDLLIKLLGITQSNSPHAVQVTTGQIKVNTSTEDNLESIGPGGLAAQLEQDAREIRRRYNLSDFDIVAYGSDHDEESAWIFAQAVLRLEWDTDEWNSLPSPSLLRYIPDELGTYGDEYGFLKDYGVDLISADNKIIAQFEVNNAALTEAGEHFYSDDEFDDFLEALAGMERHGGKVGVVRHVVEQFMKREGHMKGGAIMKLGYEIQNGDHKMLEWEWHVEEGYDDPFEHIAAEARMWLKYGDVPEEVVKKVFYTREFWLDIRKRMHAPIHENFGNKYYVDIEKFIGTFDGEEVEFKLNYAVGEDDPDDTVEIFQQMIEHWDDEDDLYALFNTVLQEYAVQAADLTPMKDPQMDMNRDENFNERKNVSGQQLFNSWREFLSS